MNEPHANQEATPLQKAAGGFICPSHGLVYGSCASCWREQREKERQDYIDRLRAERDSAHADGFRAGVEAAAGVVERCPYNSAEALVATIRAIQPPEEGSDGD